MPNLENERKRAEKLAKILKQKGLSIDQLS